MRYFVTCARGLEPILAKEIAALSATEIAPGRGGVHVTGDDALLYRMSLHLRTAVRVLMPVAEGHVDSADDLYDFCKAVDWSRHMTPDHTLAVDCNVRDSAITHSQYAARRVKDAICDQFMARARRRPDVNPDQPAVGLNLHIHANHTVLSLDASWHSLHKRGWRPVQTRAPINEALAAGLLLAAGYDGSQSLADIMCGSGTFPVEAACIATRRPPNLDRKWFGFMGWPSFNRGLWSALKDDARKAILPAAPHPIQGSDIRGDAVRFADGNARAAGVRHTITLEVMDLHFARPPGEDKPKGLVVVNPPYGERLDDIPDLIALHRDLGHTFRLHWLGWKLLVFTANDTLAKAVDLRIRKQLPFYNGSIPCKLWEMDCFA